MNFFSYVLDNIIEIRKFILFKANTFSIFLKKIKFLCVIFTSVFLVNFYAFSSEMTCYETLLVTDNNKTISRVNNQFIIKFKQDGDLYKNFKIEGIDCTFLQVNNFDTDYIKLICESYASEEDIVSDSKIKSIISISRFTGDLIRIYSFSQNKNEINFKGSCKKSQ